ncbi:MAG: hypothetical protein GXZ15_04615 [Campylobacter sp.]|nr:hypothetical protein [Campylobacter sp.]
MILAYKFNYTHTSGYLAYFLDYYAKLSDLRYSINFSGNELTLCVDADEDELLKFSDDNMVLVPNSVFLEQSTVEVLDDMLENNFEIPKEKFSAITPFSIKNFCQNEYGILSEISLFKDGKFIKVDSENFDDLLEFCYRNLFHNQLLKFRNSLGEFEMVSGLNFNSTFIMPTSFLSLNKAFIADEKTLITLASFEKPVVDLKISSVFRDNHPDTPKFHSVKGASDLFIFKLLAKLYENNLFFVSVSANFKPFKVLILDDEILTLNNGEFDLVEVAGDIVIKDGIYHKNGAKLLKFREFDSFLQIKDEILSDEIGAKLYLNFSAKSKFPSDEIVLNDTFVAILDIVSKVLFGKDYTYLIECANSFLGKKGPSIDCLIEDGKFDTLKFIRSGMSFKLAGIEDEVLSFGYLESLVQFLDDYLCELQGEINFTTIVIKDEIFRTKAGINLAKTLLSKSLNPKFSLYD